MAQQSMARAAAAVMVCALGAALVQLAVQILRFPAPVAVTGLTVMAAALLLSLHRFLRAGAKLRCENPLLLTTTTRPGLPAPSTSARESGSDVAVNDERGRRLVVDVLRQFTGVGQGVDVE